MRSADYIPGRDGDFVEWSANLIAVCRARTADWQLDAEKITELRTLHERFRTLYELCRTPAHSALDAQEKKAAETELKAAERHLAAQLQANDAVTDTDRAALGITVRDKTHTPVPAPTVFPVVSADTSVPLNIKVNFHAEGGRGKPAGAHGAEIRWAKRETPPESLDELTVSAFSTRSPYALEFDLSERGKKLFFAARWESPTGAKGPWSAVGETAVP